MNIIKLLVNLSPIIKTLKDLETTVADLFAGKNVGDDLKNVLKDLADLVESGVISIPGISADETAQLVSELRGAFGLAVAEKLQELQPPVV